MKKQKAFTLVELIFSIILIFFLTLFSFKLYAEMQRASDLKNIQKKSIKEKRLNYQALLKEIILIKKDSIEKKKNHFTYETYESSNEKRKMEIKEKKVLIFQNKNNKWVLIKTIKGNFKDFYLIKNDLYSL
jgi:type II secretory pathway pseudopilin PulG